MTQLERLIQAHTQRATLETIATRSDTVAEEMARELLRDPVIRTELKALVLAAFKATWTSLKQQRPARTTRRRRASFRKR